MWFLVLREGGMLGLEYQAARRDINSALGGAAAWKCWGLLGLQEGYWNPGGLAWQKAPKSPYEAGILRASEPWLRCEP